MSNLEDWLHDDITWCGSPCQNEECFRHLSNRKTTGIFTMSLLKGTDLCPLSRTQTIEIEMDGEKS